MSLPSIHSFPARQAPGARLTPLRRLAVRGALVAAAACGQGVDSLGGAESPVRQLALTPETVQVSVGETARFVATATGARGEAIGNPTLRWGSGDPQFATVSATGVATAVAPGTARIHVASGALADTGLLVVTAAAAPADVSVDITTSERFPISRFIYGMNLTADDGGTYRGRAPWYGAVPPREITLDRAGGNRFTAYNWENNFSNAGSDYQFQSDEFLSQSRTPGEAVRTRVAAARGRGAAAIVTVPMIGYVAADGAGPMDTRDATRAARLAARFRESRPTKGSAFSLTPDTRDAFVHQDEFVHWVKQTFPGAIGDAQRPIMFSLDNEPDSWHATHKQIMSDSGDSEQRPRLQTYEGFFATSTAYARAIKSVAPEALVIGPAVATYTGVVTMGRYPHPDPKYGSQSFVDLYLAHMRQAEAAAGQRLLDALDIHWYPATGTNAGEISNDFANQDAAMIRARLQAPRSLWDPSYTEGSWVSGVTSGPIELLPRLKRLIAANYPGTKLAITEYYYGRAGDISGGIAQADVLGIFGREGVHTAAFWPQAGVYAQPYAGDGAKAYAFAFGAFRMFLNYDGANARFGDIGVAATNPDPASTSFYASVDDQQRVVVVAINKTTSPQVASLRIQHPTALRTAHPYLLSAASPNPTPQASVTLGAGNVLRYTLPPMSVTTLQLRP